MTSMVDPDGKAWYSDFGHQIVGKLDPKTGDREGFPDSGAQAGTAEGRARSRARPDGNIWVGDDVSGRHRQDRPQDPGGDRPIRSRRNGSRRRPRPRSPRRSIRMSTARSGSTTRRPTTATGSMSRPGNSENIGQSKDPPDRQRSAPTACPPTRNNNVYLLDFGDTHIGLRNARRGRSEIWATPTEGRGRAAAASTTQGRLWFAEYRRQRHRHVRSEDREDQGMEDADAVERAL